jgi:hypothetical protein
MQRIGTRCSLAQRKARHTANRRRIGDGESFFHRAVPGANRRFVQVSAARCLRVPLTERRRLLSEIERR